MDRKQIIIFDTTLRDGEQALQASLNVKQKLQIAQALERLGVDVMEVGFPVSSPGDFNSVHTIAKEIKNSTVCALARCVRNDIEAAAQALAPAKKRRIHTFLATSPLHLQSKLNTHLDNAIELAQSSIKLARNYTDDVEFSCEDAGRTPIDDLCRIVEMAIHAGASTINIPDTVGYTLPWEFAAIIQQLLQRVPNIDRAILSVHCHDDLGLSVANSLTAIHAGARQIEGTMNGLGERAGNCALEEVIMAIQLKRAHLPFKTNINSKEIYRTSQLISQLCNISIPTHKAIIGSNAFAHSSGIHQDGVLKNRETYEILSPESIGLSPKLLNLTSRSGRAAIQHRMSLLGYQTQDYDLDKLYESFLSLADKKGQIFDYDLEALVFMDLFEHQDNHFELLNFNVITQANHAAHARVDLNCGSVSNQSESNGNGPIDALYQAIIAGCHFPIEIINYKIASKGEGKEALGQVDIIVASHGKRFHGVGLATDIVAASAQALLYVLNLAWRSQHILQTKTKQQEAQ